MVRRTQGLVLAVEKTAAIPDSYRFFSIISASIMPCPYSADQGKCRPWNEEARMVRVSSSQHISWLCRIVASSTKSQAFSSQEKMDVKPPRWSLYPHPRFWAQLWMVLCPTPWSTEGENDDSRSPHLHHSDYSVMHAEAAKTVAVHRRRLFLSAASASKQKSHPEPHEEYCCEYGSLSYLVLCSLGGVLSCGATHTAVVPLDVVKCRMQVEPGRYRGLVQGLNLTVREEGLRGLVKGWAPTAIGYSMQGLGKFGLYEYFKIYYSDLLGPEQAYLWRTSVYLAASASAEFFADIALAPMEAVKVRIQTQHGYANTLREAVPKMYFEEGLWAFYKGVSPLWMRQIPYTMMKFSCFERTVEALYKYVVPKPRDKCSKMEQLGVTFVGGYIAGIFCAIVSHPADSVVSVLNKEKGSTAIGVLRRLGMYGIWKGLFTRILMIGTLTALQWFIYDSVKVYLRLPRPPPPEMPASLKKKLSHK